ncbi:hypothetical protein FB567DRAFT_190593 [Paraphoma chrysanthemicola]|uniref:Pheromone-regulated membrane protein 6 n=1 Tax=Paraphoma chrysanthemicola TaxID=798071 RepID=A0A8K0QW79_9PLEO|nr:hypothetical protein FB567DRAFT_190593 [Paraphoma chrysanthemicola]
MGCCGDREKGLIVSDEQKWDYINLSDFKSTSCLAPFSYAWLWILVIVSCAIYGADAFTAVNLLAFSKWNSQVKPAVPFDVAKWIFAITIIISYVFLLYRYFRALRVVKSGSVTECYLEPLAAIWQSMRITKSGQGWRRFLVFAELTKSKKGANYIALGVYFQFKGALLIIVAQGPRIAINAMTLYAVMQAQLLPIGEHASKDRSNFEQFFFNIKFMIETGNKQETVIYFTMLFSLVIWVIGALGLLISALLYVLFLWHYIPQADGTLTQYCRRKVETRLERIVGKKVKKAIEKADQKRREEERKAIKKGNLDPSQTRPTLPKLDQDDDSSSIAPLQRSDTMQTNTTLPPYSVNAPARTNTMSTNRTAMNPTLPTLNERPGVPTRSNTQFSNFSNTSYRSNAPLLDQAGGMGTATPMDPMPPLDRRNDYFGQQSVRPFTPSSRPFTPQSQGRASPMPPRGVLPPVDTSYSSNRLDSDPHMISPLPTDLRGPSPAHSTRPYPEFSPFDSRGPNIGQSYELSPVDMTPSSNAPQHYYSNSNSSDEYRPPQLPSTLRAGSPAMSQPQAGLPNGPRAGTAPPPRVGTAPPRPGLPASLQSAIQRREASQPLPNRGMNGSVQQRSATAPIQQPSWNAGNMDRSYTPAAPPNRSYTPSGQPDRSYTPASQPDRSYTPASQRGYDQGYDQSYRY